MSHHTLSNRPSYSDDKPQLDVYSLGQVEHDMAQNPARVIVSTIVNGQYSQVVIKRQEDARPQLGYVLLKWMAAALRQPLFRPVPAPGGQFAQQIEIRRLQSLNQAGVNVPRVLHVASDWIALECVGSTSLEELIRDTTDTNQQLAYWTAGLAAILDVHHKDQNLSQVFVRNMMWHQDQVFFIDFEDDPASILGLDQAQARDWLLYLLSTAWLLKAPIAQIIATLDHYIQQDRLAVSNAFYQATRSVAWLRHLPNRRKPWGRDVITAHALGEVVYQYRNHNSVR